MKVLNMDIAKGDYITAPLPDKAICPVFRKVFPVRGEIRKASLEITALGVYKAELNGRRIGEFILAPGWTSYQKRLQVQTYDVTGLLRPGTDNELFVTVGRGWFRSPMPGFVDTEDKKLRYEQPGGLIAALTLTYAGGREEVIRTDDSWECGESPVRFSEIYDGERYDACFETKEWKPASILTWPKEILIPQEGEEIREMEEAAAQRVFRTPKGELVVDFGQEVTGYVKFSVNAAAGDRVRFVHGEVLDAEGNFYNANYRSAKAEVEYICRGGEQTWQPQLTFFGFRYICLLEFPGEARAEQFRAVVIHSAMRRTGRIECGEPMLNRLFSNVVWGQLGNFVDVPTDCPQRDERLGWTGDAQVFVKAASLNFDVERFFRKWLRDLAADQRESGEVGQVIPDLLPEMEGSAAWGDAALICPWQIYQTYGDSAVLAEQFHSMKKWVDFIGTATNTPDMWTGHFHFGDWLGLDAPSGSYKGSSRDDLIATAFYANSTELLIKSGRVLGRDMSEYEALYERIAAAFRRAFPEYRTQTEHVLAVRFHLAEDLQKTADALAEMIVKDGTQLKTGFVGTPYLLHVLSDYGHADLAWKLLLRREYPSWLYPVGKGATTVWEHWDGIREDGTFWSTDMNSFNHYAYGAVTDWVYEKAAGIFHEETEPGFTKLVFEPHPCSKVGWMKAELKTRKGEIRSAWRFEDGQCRIELETPVPAQVRLGSGVREVPAGRYLFWEQG